MTRLCVRAAPASKSSISTYTPFGRAPAEAAMERPAEAVAVIDQKMKNRYLTLALLTSILHAHGQQDSLYRRHRISRTDIEVLFGYYTQDGNHSAITGGTGTEKLRVYSPEFTITHYRDSSHTLILNGGVDIISSASMDNIDYIISSASRLSARTH